MTPNGTPKPEPRGPLPTLLGLGETVEPTIEKVAMAGKPAVGGEANDNGEAEVNKSVHDTHQALSGASSVDLVKDGGESLQGAEIASRKVLHRTIANVDLQKELPREKSLLIGRIDAKWAQDQLKISAVDVNSPSTLSRDKLKGFIAESAGQKTKKIPGMFERLSATFDVSTGTLNSSSSDFGPRCYVVNVGEGGVIAETGEKGTMTANTANVSQAEDLKLPKKSVLVVMTKKVLDALGMEISPTVEYGSELFEAQIAASIDSAIQKCTDKDGVLDQENFYQEIAKSYAKTLKTENKYEAIISSILVYQYS